jgi:drug/metabolite transporter (DMT)-like permease
LDRTTAYESKSGKAAIIWGVLWMVSYFGARAALETMSDTQGDWSRVAVALIPIVPFVAFLLSFIRTMRAADELERRIQLEALAIAYPLAIVLIMLLALVQLAVPLNPNDWSYRHVWPFLPIFWLAGQAIARRRYQ